MTASPQTFSNRETGNVPTTPDRFVLAVLRAVCRSGSRRRQRVQDFVSPIIAQRALLGTRLSVLQQKHPGTASGTELVSAPTHGRRRCRELQAGRTPGDRANV